MPILKTIPELKQKAKENRRTIIEMLAKSKSGHPGGSLSVIDIVTTLYYHEMKFDPKNPKWDERDRFVLCKGHAAPAQYTVLADLGFFDKSHLMTLRQLGSILQGHPERTHTPGVETFTGSLGQGLSVASGMAMGFKLDKKPNRVYAVLGDGDIYEGQTWEAMATIPHHKLDNLVAIMDRNKIITDGSTEKIKAMDSMADKAKAFGWHTIEIDGHNIEQIVKALEEAKNTKGKPTFIVANTIKGKGVSFMEGQAKYHGVAPTQEEKEKALLELA